MILQYTVVYMHISWFIHISHTTVRTLRPKPLLKGLSSKASEKITHRLKVFSRAVGLLKVTRLHHVPQAVSSTVLHPFQSNWPQHGSSALALKYLKLPPFTSYIGLMIFFWDTLQVGQLSFGYSMSQAVNADFQRGFIIHYV